jgi:hypothetical protein
MVAADLRAAEIRLATPLSAARRSAATPRHFFGLASLSYQVYLPRAHQGDDCEADRRRKTPRGRDYFAKPLGFLYAAASLINRLTRLPKALAKAAS